MPRTQRHSQTPTGTSPDRKHDLIRAWYHFIGTGTQNPPNYRIELTLKQQRESALKTRRPKNRVEPEYKYDDATRDARSGFLVRRARITQLVDQTASVRVRSRRVDLRDAPLYAPYYYLTAEEGRRIAVRIMNRLNGEILGHASRRGKDRQRLTAVVCMHDRGTRRHLHGLVAAPPGMDRTTFKQLFDRACQGEPFLYRVTNVEPITNVAGSVIYDINDDKALDDNCIAYIYPNRAAAADEEDAA